MLDYERVKSLIMFINIVLAQKDDPISQVGQSQDKTQWVWGNLESYPVTVF